jgi:hypothetical protein
MNIQDKVKSLSSYPLEFKLLVANPKEFSVLIQASTEVKPIILRYNPQADNVIITGDVLFLQIPMKKLTELYKMARQNKEIYNGL